MSRHVPGDQGKPATTPKGRGPYFYAYRSNSRVDRLEASHPGLRALVESLLRRRVRQAQISRRVRKRFGVRLSPNSISRYYLSRVRPAEQAEATAYRQAHAQARALLEEMKADPTLDAAQIAELMLAGQIFRDRTKLAEADIMDLYREQRERAKLDLQRRALELREEKAKKMLKDMETCAQDNQLTPETLRRIREIYGLFPDAPAAASVPREAADESQPTTR